MADKDCRLPDNAPGRFYVDDQCIDCDACRETAPDFFCGANAPVSDIGGGVMGVTVITLTIGVFTADPVEWFIVPGSDPSAHSIPGGLAITDADDVFRLNPLYPSSGSFTDPARSCPTRTPPGVT